MLTKLKIDETRGVTPTLEIRPESASMPTRTCLSSDVRSACILSEKCCSHAKS